MVCGCQETVSLVQLLEEERQTVSITVLIRGFSYENHICAEGLRVEWLPEEERRLVELHNEVGNKWSLIAAQIPGKYIKFYSGATTA